MVRHGGGVRWDIIPEAHNRKLIKLISPLRGTPHPSHNLNPGHIISEHS